mmetsp:Transcript_15271/g.58060  ORF Transcript_15271/g.58060 Transcript_15271/m.58060 type:complete len:214 (-) Transcript_15271:3297-3938(-)
MRSRSGEERRGRPGTSTFSSSRRAIAHRRTGRCSLPLGKQASSRSLTDNPGKWSEAPTSSSTSSTNNSSTSTSNNSTSNSSSNTSSSSNNTNNISNTTDNRYHTTNRSTMGRPRSRRCSRRPRQCCFRSSIRLIRARGRCRGSPALRRRWSCSWTTRVSLTAEEAPTAVQSYSFHMSAVPGEATGGIEPGLPRKAGRRKTPWRRKAAPPRSLR